MRTDTACYRSMGTGFLLAVVGGSLFSLACAPTYIVEFRDGQTGSPIADAPVTISSAPRFYSFLDPRYYLGPEGRPVVVSGRTDSDGQFAVKMPDDLAIWTITVGQSRDGEMSAAEWRPDTTLCELATQAAASRTACPFNVRVVRE